jgi:hypothetical protein
MIFANGNNLVLVGNLVRRALLCSMDAKVERPELRTFNIDAKNMARANRARLIVATLTILRAAKWLAGLAERETANGPAKPAVPVPVKSRPAER